MNSERGKNTSATGNSPFDLLVADTRQVLSEGTFRGMIAIERKRSERSRQPFLLMLVEVNSPQGVAHDRELLAKIADLLIPASRETDLVGWFDERTTLGVLFTGLAIGDKNTVLATMQDRVYTLLRGKLSPGQFEHVNISFHFYPDNWDYTKPGRPIDSDLYSDMLHHGQRRKLMLAVKRVIDVIGSAIALLLCLPLFYAIGIAIKVSSRGPVYFAQKRVGQFGKRFSMLKFRSMYADNDNSVHREFVTKMIENAIDELPEDANGESVFKLTHDSRITRVGKFLRRYSLDEIPQFYNVFVGQMSLVGPRPALPYELKAYQTWHRRRVLEFKPGLTGLWQVSGRSRVTFDEMVRLDLQYAATWSPWLDFKILMRTPRAVLQGSGAH